MSRWVPTPRGIPGVKLTTSGLMVEDLKIVHGTVNGYTNHRCHCQDCRDAWARYYREQRYYRFRVRGVA